MMCWARRTASLIAQIGAQVTSAKNWVPDLRCPALQHAERSRGPHCATREAPPPHLYPDGVRPDGQSFGNLNERRLLGTGWGAVNVGNGREADLSRANVERSRSTLHANGTELHHCHAV